MSDKDAAKRRRQARNRQERQNRQKRTEGAQRAAARPARTADGKGAATTRPARGAAGGREGRPSRTATEAPAPGGLLGKLFPPRPAPAKDADGEAARPARPARAPMPRQSYVAEVEVGDATGARAWFVRALAQPGGRPALMAVPLAVVVSVLLFTAPLAGRNAFEAYGAMVVRDQAGAQGTIGERLVEFEEADPVLHGTERLTEVVPVAAVAGLALLVLLAAAVAARSLTRPSRSRALMISTVMVGFMTVFFGYIALPLVAVLGFATFKSRQYDRMRAVEDADAEA